MQQPDSAQSPPQRDAAADWSLVQKMFGSKDRAPIQQRSSVPPDDSDLDQRVRESGEW